MALLDLLLKMSQNDQEITDKDIKDQVNTFMFAVSIYSIHHSTEIDATLDNFSSKHTF